MRATHFNLWLAGLVLILCLVGLSYVTGQREPIGLAGIVGILMVFLGVLSWGANRASARSHP